MINYYKPVWIAAYNSGSYPIEPHRLAEISDASMSAKSQAQTGLALHVQRPTQDNAQRFVVNGHQTIEPEGHGFVAIHGPVCCDVSDSGSVYAENTLGTNSGTTTPWVGNTGLLVLIPALTDTLALVDFAPPITQVKMLCLFTLDATLTTVDEYVDATIQAQYGVGLEHGTTDITVYNMPTHDGSYEFYGDSGDYGYAYWSGSGTDWIIIMLECP